LHEIYIVQTSLQSLYNCIHLYDYSAAD